MNVSRAFRVCFINVSLSGVTIVRIVGFLLSISKDTIGTKLYCRYLAVKKMEHSFPRELDR